MSRLRGIAVLISASLALATASFAQSETLLIGAGDLIHVQVFDTPELDQKVRVTDQGLAPLLFLGETKLAGMTPAQAARVIEKGLVDGQFLLHPHVSVIVDDYATQGVSVLGQVQHPGSFKIDTAKSVVDVLALAGGLTEGADRHITIQRRNSEERVSYFVSNNPEEALKNSVTVRPGDTIVVPKAGVVYVLGDVGRPGGYLLNDNDSKLTIVQAIARAGGTNKSASPNKARLIRKSGDSFSESTIKLAAMQKGKQPDMDAQPGDVIYVPFSYARNIALGASSIVAATSSAALYAAP